MHAARSLDHLGDFTTTRRVLPLSALAILIGAVAAYVADEPLCAVVFRIAESGVTEMPVIGRRDGKVVGAIALADLLKARGRVLDAERRRERVLGKRLRLPRRKSGIV